MKIGKDPSLETMFKTICTTNFDPELGAFGSSIFPTSIFQCLKLSGQTLDASKLFDMPADTDRGLANWDAEVTTAITFKHGCNNWCQFFDFASAPLPTACRWV